MHGKGSAMPSGRATLVDALAARAPDHAVEIGVGTRPDPTLPWGELIELGRCS